MAIQGFLSRVNSAVRLVTEKYPEAKLLEVEGTASAGSAQRWLDIDELRVVFRAGKAATALIDSEGWNEWGPVRYIKKPWVEDVVISWPIKLELASAVQLMRDAGYKDSFVGVTLRYPLYPGIKQAYYIFAFGDGKYVFVGVEDHTVTNHT